jgi:predicted site-specific integrase-resolvase
MKLSSYAKKIGISYNSAWRMWKRGQIPGYQLPTGTVIIDPPELRSVPVHAVAVYARVSGKERRPKGQASFDKFRNVATLEPSHQARDQSGGQ